MRFGVGRINIQGTDHSLLFEKVKVRMYVFIDGKFKLNLKGYNLLSFLYINTPLTIINHIKLLQNSFYVRTYYISVSMLE